MSRDPLSGDDDEEECPEDDPDSGIHTVKPPGDEETEAGKSTEASPPEDSKSINPSDPSITLRDSLNPNLIFGFTILKELGRGGMGMVYEAKQENPERLVALKVIHVHQATSEAFVRRFKTEAEAVGNLQHPNVVTLYESGEYRGTPYLTMPLISGCTLAAGLRKRKWTALESAELVRTIANAVSHAHSKGVLHRDLKPANVLLDGEETPFVSDFGLAKLVNNQDDLTMPGAILGSPAYMAPEQAAGALEEVSTSTDVYGVGTILYECLTGHPPFKGDNAARVLQQVLTDEPKSPRSIDKTIDLDLATICLKCLEKKPEDRYRSASDLESDLNGWMLGKPITARQSGYLERTIKWSRRNPVVAALSSGLLTSVLAGLIFYYLQAEEIRFQAEETRRAYSILKINTAETETIAGHSGKALAMWANILRYDPTNTYVANRIVDLMVNKNYPRAHPPMIDLKEWLDLAVPAPDMSAIFLTSTNGNAALFATDTGRKIVGLPVNERIFAAAFRHGGKQLATGNAAGELQIWDLPDGAPLVSRNFPHPIRGIAYDAGGKRLAVMSGGRATLLVVSNNLKELELELPATRGNPPDQVFRSLSFDPTGEYLAGGDSVGGVFVWRSMDGSLLERAQHDGSITRLAFTQSGRRLFASSQRGTVRSWSIGSTLERGSSFDHSASVVGFALSPDGRWLATSGRDRFVRVWNVSTQEMWHEIPLDAIASDLLFDTRSELLLVISDNHSARLWNIPDRSPASEHLSHGSRIILGTLQPEAALAMTTSETGKVRKWNYAKRRSSYRADAGASFVEFSSDGSQLLAATTNGIVNIWEPNESTVHRHRLDHGARLYMARFSPDGRKVVSAGTNKIALLWRFTGTQWESFEKLSSHSGPVRTASFNTISETLLTSALDSDRNSRVRIWSSRTGEILFRPPFKHTGWITPVEFNPDGRSFATGSNNGDVTVWRLEPRERLFVVNHNKRILWLEFSPDGSHLVTASEDGFARVINATTGEQQGQSMSHGDAVVCARFSPDGVMIATSSRDRTAKLWRFPDLAAIGRTMNHRDTIPYLEFFPDNRRLLTVSWDTTARIWDTRNGNALSAPLIHPTKVRHASIHPTGKYFVTGDDSTSLRIWRNPKTPEIPESIHLSELAEALARFSIPIDMDFADPKFTDSAVIEQARSNPLSSLLISK